MTVILVRHARPVEQPGVHPVRWRLDDTGRWAAVHLAEVLPAQLAPTVWSSHEARAAETAEQIAKTRGLDVRTDPDLREVGGPMAWTHGFDADAASYLGGGLAGWEDGDQVVQRLSTVIDHASADSPTAPVVVVTHGVALAAYVGARLGLPAAAFYADLRYPDAWQYDAVAGVLKRLGD